MKRQSRRGSSIRAIESIVVLKQEVRWTLKEGVFFFAMNQMRLNSPRIIHGPEMEFANPVSKAMIIVSVDNEVRDQLRDSWR